LLREYRFVKDKLNIEVENILNGVEKLIRDESCREIVKSFDAFRDLALLHQSFPSKLKQSILQEAISGRLVPQNPDDNAESLLNHINERRAALVKAKIIENKYGKELQIDADEYDVDLPQGWVICKLGNIAKITAGGTPARGIHKYWTGGNIPWLKIADITSSGKYVNSASEYITEEGVKNSSAKLMKKGTLLYTIFASIGEVAILNFEATCNQAIANIDLYEPEMTEYIYYYLKNLQAYMYSISKGCAQLNINQDILKNAIVPLPPLDEQKRIVAKLEEILPQIDKLGKL
jgi:type I restriction enzyme S subunit